MKVRTEDEVKDELRRKGISIARWARANGFDSILIYQLLAKRKKGLRGEAHRAAVMLGLKKGEIVKDNDIESTLAARIAA